MVTHLLESVHRIVYLSRAIPRLEAGAVEELVAAARIKNQQQGITGALLFERGHFFQVLEGPEANVKALFREISTDRRHQEVRLLIEDDLERRQFASWSLAWNRESDEILSEHFEDLKAWIASSDADGTDLGSIQKFLVLFHGLLTGESNHQRKYPVRSVASATLQKKLANEQG